ncbi:TonB-dependent receptor [Pedobacter sp. SYSU D00535]|uniref:SusC/RagA family TonB-linked outer membrane protein n=1 Tax=Pedobacter sp. SYSU D00535 TaxID=2810308 RepID=UPI001A965F4A|nr:TonB-dependent receptor [Pedobacter sp. SYSU D00535]
MKRNKLRELIPIVLMVLSLLGTGHLTFAQGVRIIKGTVTDENGEALPGASVVAKGTKAATTTNIEGQYTINVPEGASTLVFTFIGMEAQEVAIGNSATINIRLRTTATALNDVVVVGYGTQRKSDLTGAVQRVSREDLIREAPTNVLQAMQGKMAGVTVTQSEGAPGAGINIRVRGTNSFQGTSEPLYVIDGIPFNNSSSAAPSSMLAEEKQSINALAFINPSDIESIDVLKDASATAIYGSRGANGVVLITTRKGKSGKDKLEFNLVSGVSSVSKRYSMLSPYDYAFYQNLAHLNANKYAGMNYTQDQLPYPGMTVTGPNGPYYKNGPDDYGSQTTNWQDDIFRNGVYQNYSMNVSGGSDAGNHSISFNYLNQEGTIINSNYKKYGLNLNLNRNVGRVFTIGTSTSIANSVNNGVKTNVQRSDNADAGVIRAALTFPSTIDSVQTFADASAGGQAFFITNPVIYSNDVLNRITSLNLFSANYIEATITKNLKFRQNLGANLASNNRDQYYPKTVFEGFNRGGAGLKGVDSWNNIASESMLTFNQQIEKHSINAVVVGTYEVTSSYWRNQQASNFPTELLRNEDLSLGQNQATPQMQRSKSQLQSFLGRINYSFADKYLFTASFRRDGSSKFGANNKYANFPSASIAWRVINEPFLKDKSTYLSDLKLRFSYGQTGNQGIAPYGTLDKLINYPYVLGGAQVVGIGPDYWSGPGNPDLKWETTEAVNLGLDLGLFQNKLTLTVDAYHKDTKDLLQQVTVPTSTGFPFKLINAGNITNRGLEFTLNAVPFRTKDFDWSSNFNISFNRNRIESLGGSTERNFAPNISTNDAPFIQIPGRPIGALYGYVEDGYYDNEAEVRNDLRNAGLNDALVKKMIGEIKYKDLDGDPTTLTEKDRTFIGNVNPDYTLGFSNNFRYRSWDASFLVNAVVGNDIINMNTRFMGLPGNFQNITQEMYEGAWQEGADNSKATGPKIIRDFSRQTAFFSRRYIEDGSFVRLKNLTIGYNVKTKLAGMQGLKISVMANNLFTITKYTGYDPEVNSYGNQAALSGVDLGGYPNIRSFNLNVRANF